MHGYIWVYTYVYASWSFTFSHVSYIDPIRDPLSPIAMHVAMSGLVCTDQLGLTP